MARVEVPITVDKLVSSNWQPASGASVQINVRGGGAATLYSAATGGVTVANPALTDSEGRVTAYVEEGSYDAVISGSGITTNTVEFEAVRGDAIVSISTTRIGATQITEPKLANNAVSTRTVAAGAIDESKLAVAVIANMFQPGFIIASGASTAPTGWLLCDGASYSTSTYPALFSAIGTTWGSGSGTFKVPDLRSRTLMGSDNMGTGAANRIAFNPRSIGNTGGVEAHSHALGSDGAHTHTFDRLFDHYHTGTTSGPQVAGSVSAIAGANGYLHNHTFVTSAPSEGVGQSRWGTTDSAGSHSHGGGTGGANSLPPYGVVYWLIKT